jgi:hypothetical protein
LGVGPSVVVFWRLITPKVQKQGAEELPVDKALVSDLARFVVIWFDSYDLVGFVHVLTKNWNTR